jgi:hypothetical protein
LKVSAAITSMMSEICITSSRAATRGMTFLPDVVAAGAISVSYPSASETISAASGSASRLAYSSPSA